MPNSPTTPDDLQTLRAKARTYEQQHPDDVLNALQLWRAVLRLAPEDLEAQAAVRRLEQRRALAEARKEFQDLFQQAKEAFQRGARDDVLLLRDLRNKMRDLLERHGRLLGEEAKEQSQRVQKWYRELSDQYGQPISLYLQGKVGEGLREAYQALAEGREIFDPEKGEWRPAQKVYEELVEAYIQALPTLLARRWRDIETYLDHDPGKAAAALAEAQAWLEEEALPEDKRGELEEQYAADLHRYQTQVAEAQARYNRAQRLIEQARQTQDPVLRWRFLRQAQEAFPNHPDLAIELGTAAIAVEGEALRRLHLAQSRARQALDDRAYADARAVLDEAEAWLYTVWPGPEELPPAVRQQLDALEALRVEVARQARAAEVAQSLLPQISAALERGDLDEAEALLEQLPEAWKQHPQARRYRALLQARREKDERASRLKRAYYQREWSKVITLYHQNEAQLSERQEIRTLRDRARVAQQAEAWYSQLAQGDLPWNKALNQGRKILQKFETLGLDESVEKIYEQVKERVENLQKILKLRDKMETWIAQSRKDMGRPLSTPRALEQLLTRWQEGQRLKHAFTSLDIGSEGQEILEQFEAAKRALEEKIREGFHRFYNRITRKMRTSALTNEDIQFLEDLQRMYEKARDVGFLRDYKTYEARRREIEVARLDAQYHLLQQKTPIPCEELRRNRARRQEMSENDEEWARIAEQIRTLEQTCFLNRVEKLLEQDTTFGSEDEVASYIQQVFQEHPSWLNDPEILKKLWILLIKAGRLDILQDLERRLSTDLSSHAYQQWLQAMNVLHTFWKEVAQATQEKRVIEFSYKDLDKTFQEKMEGLNQTWREAAQQVQKTLYARWREALEKALHQQLDSNTKDARSILRLVESYRRLFKRPPRIEGLNLEEHNEQLFQEVEEELEKWIQGAAAFIGNILSHSMKKRPLRNDWRQLKRQLTAIKGSLEYLKNADVIREDVQELEQTIEQLEDISKQIENFLEKLQRLQYSDRGDNQSRKKLLERLVELKEELDSIFQNVVQFTLKVEPIHDAVKRVSDNILEFHDQINRIEELYRKWKQAWQESEQWSIFSERQWESEYEDALQKLQEAQKAMQELSQLWREYGARYAEAWPAVKQGLKYRYIFLGREVQTPQEHLDALEEIERDLREWARRIREIEAGRDYIREVEQYFTLTGEIRKRKLQEEEMPVAVLLKDIQERQAKLANLLEKIKTYLQDDLRVTSALAEQFFARAERLKEELETLQEKLKKYEETTQKARDEIVSKYQELGKLTKRLELFLKPKKKFGLRLRRTSQSPSLPASHPLVKTTRKFYEACHSLDPYHNPDLLRKAKELLAQITRQE